MTNALICWKCGASLAELPLPLGRLAECLACHAELHVCRMCEFYDPQVTTSCNEPRAEEVKDKERANFCEYFKPRPDAYCLHDDTEARAARAQLDALFGSDPREAWKSPSHKLGPHSEAERAREELEQLFGLEGKRDK
jgi:hypothetical protein